jgi:hypothetical protein
MSGLARPNTVKRKIQIREYVATQRRTAAYSDPFAPQEELDPRSTLKARPVSFRFKKKGYQPEDDPDYPDEILTKKVDLDEADRFIAALKLPTKSLVKDHPAKPLKPRLFTSSDLSLLHRESEKLEQARLALSEDPVIEDDWLI